MKNSISIMAVTAATLALSAAATAPTRSSEKKYQLRHVYHADDRLLLSYNVVEEKKSSGKVAGDMSAVSKLLITLAVSEGAKPGEKLVRLQFRRIVSELKAGELHRAVDSSKPETVPPGMPLDELTKATFTAATDEAGKIVTFAGVKEFVEKSKLVPADAQEKEKQRIETAVEAGLRQLLQEPFIYFPDKPAGVGESWTLERKTYGLPIMGALKVHDEEVKCKLAEVKETKDGRIAVITIAGESAIAEGAMPGDAKTLKKTGKVEYNLDKNMLLSHHIELEGSGVIPMGDGQQMKFSARTAIDTAIGRDTEEEPRNGKERD